MSEIILSTESYNVEIFDLDTLLNRLQLIRINDFKNIPQFNNTEANHRHLFHSVCCSIMKKREGVEVLEELKSLGFSNPENALEELKSQPGVLFLFEILYYSQKYPDSGYFHQTDKPKSASHLFSICNIINKMIKEDKFSDISEIFYIFSVLLDELIEEHFSYEQIMKDLEDLKMRNLVNRMNNY